MRRRSILFFDEIFGARDEIGERVLLVEQFPVIVPSSPKIAAAPDMREGKNDPAIQQTETIR